MYLETTKVKNNNNIQRRFLSRLHYPSRQCKLTGSLLSTPSSSVSVLVCKVSLTADMLVCNLLTTACQQFCCVNDCWPAVLLVCNTSPTACQQFCWCATCHRLLASSFVGMQCVSDYLPAVLLVRNVPWTAYWQYCWENSVNSYVHMQ